MLLRRHPPRERDSASGTGRRAFGSLRPLRRARPSAPRAGPQPVAPRPDTLIETAFSDDDLAHLPAGCDRDEWITRLWCAKEARAKQTGEGITQPKSLQITAIEGETVFVDGVPVETSRHDDWIIAATS